MAKMTNVERAKQFLPFNALRGYYELIRQKEIIKEEKRILSDEKKDELSKKLSLLKKGDMAKITYYENEAYVNKEGMVSYIDEIGKSVTLVRNLIHFDDIYEIESSVFKNYFDE